MTGLIMAAQLILGLSILVLLHELGHFIAAKSFGIKVEKFYLFFDAWGFKLFKFTYKGTEYGIGWLPLGGYVKISGMIDESMDKEAMKLPPQPWEFRSKPAWQRLIVMIGGVTVNLILGVILFTMIILVYEKEFVPNTAITNGIYPYEIGERAGFKPGDKILQINGNDVVRFKDATSLSLFFGSEIMVERNGKNETIVIGDDGYDDFKSSENKILFEPNFQNFVIDSIVPGRPADKAGFKKGDRILAVNDTIDVQKWPKFTSVIEKNRNKEISLKFIRNSVDTQLVTLVVDSAGIGVTRLLPNLPTEKYSFGQAIYYGWKDAMTMLKMNVVGMGKIFKGKEKATESLQGPIGIAQIYGGVWNWGKFWFITGLLSLILAFMNILPIPALDGGHVIFLIIEVITGKKFSDKFMERAQMVGMVILLSLMAFAVGNDIFRLFK